MTYKAAGILPITVHDGQVYFLLGKELFSRTWCDFGGRKDPNDHNNSWNTASRECWEETCGLIDARGFNPNSIKLIRGDYHMYVLQINFIDPLQFQSELLRQVNPKHREKSEIKWFTLKQLHEIDLRNVFRPYLPELRHLFA